MQLYFTHYSEEELGRAVTLRGLTISSRSMCNFILHTTGRRSWVGLSRLLSARMRRLRARTRQESGTSTATPSVCKVRRRLCHSFAIQSDPLVSWRQLMNARTNACMHTHAHCYAHLILLLSLILLISFHSFFSFQLMRLCVKRKVSSTCTSRAFRPFG
jgi:hypothetical protein